MPPPLAGHRRRSTALRRRTHDAGLEGIDGIEPVTQEEVFEVFEANLAVLRWLLLAVVAQS